MKNKFFKFLKVKLFVVLTLIALAFIALQAPLTKKYVANTFIQQVSKLTDSKVSYQAYEGMIPFSFNFYKLSFVKDDQTWLTIDRLQLHQTLLRLVFWQRKGVDLTLDHPYLAHWPFESENKTLEWPTIPFQSLSVQVRAQNVEVSDTLLNKPLIPFNLATSSHFRKKGAFFRSKIKMDFPEFEKAFLELSATGRKREQLLKLKMKLEDPQSELMAHLFSQPHVGFEGEISLLGGLDAIQAFFNPKLFPSSTFSGQMSGSLFPVKNDSNTFWKSFLNQSEIDLKSRFNFESKSGLSFENIKLSSQLFDFKGQGLLNREYAFAPLTIEGSFYDLEFLTPWIQKPTEGKVSLNASLNGFYQTPKVTSQITQGNLKVQDVLFESLKGNSELLWQDKTPKINLSLTAQTNNQPSSLKGTLFSPSPCEYVLEDFYLKIASNELASPFLKRMHQNILQGRLSLSLKQLSSFSPFIQQNVQGDLEGECLLDLELSKGYFQQKVELNLEGKSFEYLDGQVDGYSLKADGKLCPNDLKSFEGSVLFTSDYLNWKHYHFNEVGFVWTPLSSASFFKAQANGVISFSSSGRFQKQDEDWLLDLFSLRGSIESYPVQLLKDAQITFNSEKFSFTPLSLRIGFGQADLQFEPSSEALHAQITQFPLDILSAFIPKYYLQGSLSMNADLKNLFHHVKGSLKGNFRQLTLADYHHMQPYNGSFDFNLYSSSMVGQFQFSGRNKDEGFSYLELPLSFKLYPFKVKSIKQAQASIDTHYIGSINPFFQAALPANHVLMGHAALDLKLRGALDQPNVQGYIHLSDASYENLFLGLTMSHIETSLKGEGSKLVLDTFSADDDGSGKINIEGAIHLNHSAHYPFDLKASIDHGKILQFDFLNATFNGPLRFHGSLKQAKLSGDLDVTQAALEIPNRIGSSLPVLDVNYVYPQKEACANQVGSKPSFPIEYDLKLDVKEKASLSGRGLDTLWSGKIGIEGTTSNPFFRGKLKHIQGSFVFAGKILNIEEGLIKFNGDLADDTYINLIGSTSVYNARITAYLQGPFMGPKLSFRSDPPYSQTEILSLILFNEPVQKLTPFQAVALTHSLATLGGTYAGPDIVDKIRRGIGVDQLTFGSSLQGGGDYMTVQIGKYITKDILVTLNRPLEMGNSPFIITAHIRGGFQLQTTFDENEISTISILWKLSY